MPTALFTPANAAAMQAKSVASRKLAQLPAIDRYQARRLMRVREQLDKIDGMIKAETDPQKLDRLAAASMRLSDQEFALANRPKPANAKASTRGGPARSWSYPAPPQSVPRPSVVEPTIPSGGQAQSGPVQPQDPKP